MNEYSLVKGAVGEVGLVAQMAEEKSDIEIAGTVQQRIAYCLNVMDTLLSSKQSIVSSMVVAQKHIFSKMNLVQSVLHIMGIPDLKSVSKNSSLAELGEIIKSFTVFRNDSTIRNVFFKGMDSLMAVEIKQMLEREFEIILTAQDLRMLTFAKLQEFTDLGKKGDAIIKNESFNVADIQGNILLRSLGNERTADQIILPLNVTDTNIANKDCALFIPGIEGVISTALYTLCEAIEIPIYALQVHAKCKEESFSNLISSISEVR